MVYRSSLCAAQRSSARSCRGSCSGPNSASCDFTSLGDGPRGCARRRYRNAARRDQKPILGSRSGAIRSSIRSTGPTRMWCCEPAMYRSSRLPNARSRTCWSECGKRSQRAPESHPLSRASLCRYGVQSRAPLLQLNNKNPNRAILLHPSPTLHSQAPQRFAKRPRFQFPHSQAE
jgi:hypothetical protein